MDFPKSGDNFETIGTFDEVFGTKSPLVMACSQCGLEFNRQPTVNPSKLRPFVCERCRIALSKIQ